jgi:hypothetical protein
MNRRDVFKLMGLASAATFMTRFPLLPKAEAVPMLSGIQAKPAEFEVGLLREGTNEVRASGYFRVAPTRVITRAELHEVEVQAVFPTVPGWSKAWVTRGMGLYAPNKGPLLFYQQWDTGPVWLMPGNTMQATCKFTGGEGLSMYAMNKMLGLS